MSEEGYPNVSHIPETVILLTSAQPRDLKSDYPKSIVTVNFELNCESIIYNFMNFIISRLSKESIEKCESFCQSKINRLMALADSQKKLRDYICSYPKNLLDSEELPRLLLQTSDIIRHEKMSIIDIDNRIEELHNKLEAYKPLAKFTSLVTEVLACLQSLSFYYDFKVAYVLDTLQQSIKIAIAYVEELNRMPKMSEVTHVFLKEVYRQLKDVMNEVDVKFIPLILILKDKLYEGILSQRAYDLFFLESTYQFPFHFGNVPTWITKRSWENLDLLEELDVFKGIKAHMIANPSLYQEYFTLEPVLLEQSPWDDENALSIFHRALLWIYCRPNEANKVYSDLVLYELGNLDEVDYNFPRKMDDESINDKTEDSHASSPSPQIILIDKENQSDVVFSIEQDGFDQGVSVKSVCAAGCNPNFILQLLQQGAKYGHWVVITNCHVVEEWRSDITDFILFTCKVLNNPQASLPDRVDPNFNIFLVSSLYDTTSLPKCILKEMTIKTFRPEASLRESINRGILTYLSSSALARATTVPHFVHQPLAYFHGYVMRYIKEAEQLWNQKDVYNTLEVLILMRICNPGIDLEETLQCIIKFISYGSKLYVSNDIERLHSIAEMIIGSKHALTSSCRRSNHFSIMGFTKSALISSVVLDFIKSNTPVTSSEVETTIVDLNLSRFHRRAMKLDVKFVADLITSVLPTISGRPRDAFDTATNNFLQEQLTFYADMLNLIERDLSMVKLILHGDQTHSYYSSLLFERLGSNIVPTWWEKSEVGLGQWLSEFVSRVNDFNAVIEAGTKSVASSVDHVEEVIVYYSLSMFTEPKSFLLCLLYDWAVANKVNLVDVSFSVKVISLLPPGFVPETGVILRGLEVNDLSLSLFLSLSLSLSLSRTHSLFLYVCLSLSLSLSLSLYLLRSLDVFLS